MTQQSIEERILSRPASAENHDAEQPASSATKRSIGRLFLQIGLLSVLTAVLLGGGLFAATQIPAIRDAIWPSTAAAMDNPDIDLPDTPFLAHAKEAGIHACGAVFPILGQLLTGGAQYNVQSDWNAKDPDNHAIRSLVGLNIASQDYSGPAAGLVVASPNGSACEGSMIRIVPYPQNCEAVAKILPAGSVLRSKLIQTAVYDLANKGGQLMLLPSGQSCVAISVVQAARK